MRRLVMLVTGALVIVAIATTTSVTAKRAPVHAQAAPPWSGAVKEQEGPQRFLDMASSSGGQVTQAEIQRASAQADALPEASDSSRWQYVGSSNVAGRVIDVVVDPTTTPSTLYAAASTGGVFKSVDDGNTWTPAWPTRLNQAMGALARGSDGTLYAGTGEGSNPSGGGSTFMGDGLYKSTDGGATWQLSGLQDSGSFSRIVVNPDNPKEVWAAASGSLTWVSGQRGLYHSTDGGETWTNALPGIGDHVGAADVTLQPGHPNVILASLWDRYRNNGSFYYGGIGSGLYRSTDDGKTWTLESNSNISGPVCKWDGTGTGITQNADLGHIGVAFAPSDPNRAYMQFSATNGPDKGYYISNDGGVTWTCGGAQPGSSNAGYAWVFSRLWVDPANEDHIFSADVSLRVSTNAGTTWSNSNGPHSDQHGMAWDPNVPNRVHPRRRRRRLDLHEQRHDQHLDEAGGPAVDAAVPPVGLPAGRHARGGRPAGQRLHAHMDVRRRADGPDEVELLRRRRRLQRPDQPEQPAHLLPVLAADAAADQLRQACRRRGRRLDDQHDVELLAAGMAVEHACRGRDADAARPGRPELRLRRRHVDRPLRRWRRQRVDDHQPADAG